MNNYFIIEYQDCVPYEACWTDTLPVLFNGSKEELELEFEIAVEEAIKTKQYQFDFSNLKELRTELFTFFEDNKIHYNPPIFYTFEEWCLIKS
jgi:hypothetical protein